MNARPGLSIQIANNQDLVPRLKHIEGLEDYYLTVEDRVAYAMQTFTYFPSEVRQAIEPAPG